MSRVVLDVSSIELFYNKIPLSSSSSAWMPLIKNLFYAHREYCKDFFLKNMKQKKDYEKCWATLEK